MEQVHAVHAWVFGALVLQVPLYTQCVESKQKNRICWKLYLKTTQMSSDDDFFFLYLSNNRTGSLHQTTFQLIKGQAVGKVQNCN